MTAPDVNADVRARFEAWASDGGKCPKAVERTGYDDGYRLMATHLYWLAWQAAHADLAGEVRELVEADRLLDKCDATLEVHAEAKVTEAWLNTRLELHRTRDLALKRRAAALAKFHPTHQETGDE